LYEPIPAGDFPMTPQAAEYIRVTYGFVVLKSEADRDEFEQITVDYQAGRSSGALLRVSLFRLGVPADAIRRVLAGERLVTCW
jgi:hypothetical protein